MYHEYLLCAGTFAYGVPGPRTADSAGTSSTIATVALGLVLVLSPRSLRYRCWSPSSTAHDASARDTALENTGNAALTSTHAVLTRAGLLTGLEGSTMSFLVSKRGSAGLRLAFVLFSFGGVHSVTASRRRLLSSICRRSTGLMVVFTEEYRYTSLSAFVGVLSVSIHCLGESTDDSGLWTSDTS